MPKSTKTSIALAIEAIQAASKKVKVTAELEDSLEQLYSIVKLLKISKLWSSAFQRLSSLLRHRLQPLYKTFPILGIRYSVAVLGTVNELKILPALNSDDKANKDSWEVVQAALLSGILDFLEANSSSENRSIVATAFYPALRLIFFPQLTPAHSAGPDLMYILYQLLSETVTSHPANQAQLRDPKIFGSTHIGAILSQTKSFLVIEALLELFVKLLPAKSSKDGTKARADFIRDGFDPEKFASSAVILEVFESPQNADWEEIFLQIINSLASADATFPQPFKITNFRIQGSKVYPIERLYVDHQGFVANIDEGDQIETFHALYTSVQSVRVAALSKSEARVTILLSPPPSVGQAAISQPSSDGNTVIIFDIDGKEVASFLYSLNTRGIKNVDQTGRKLSTAEKSLELDYDSTRKTVPVSTQDKVRDLARLWDFSNSQSNPGQIVPTSPLVRRSPSVQILAGNVPSLSEAPYDSATPIKALKPQLSSPYYDSIFGTTDEELTDLSDVDEVKAKTSRCSSRPSASVKTRSKAEINVMLESEDKLPIARRIKSRRNIIVLSDEEMDDIRSSSNERLASPRKKGGDTFSGHSTVLKSIGTPSTALANFPSEKFIHHTTEKAADLNAGTAPNDLHTVKTTTTSPIPPQRLAPSSKEPTKPTTRKRKAVEDAVPELTDPKVKPSLSKRLRLGSEADKEVQPDPKPLPQRQHPRKRYGKKGRSSSPAPFSVIDVDFDELRTDPPTNKPEEKQRSRVLAMKDKGGKAAPTKTKPEGRKAKAMKDVALEANPARPPKGGVRPKTKTELPSIDSKAPSVTKPSNKNKTTTLDAVSEPQRRSARVAGIPVNQPLGVMRSSEAEKNSRMVPSARALSKVQLQPDDKIAKTWDKQVPSQKKPRDAPWKDLDLKKSAATPTKNAIETVAKVPSQPTHAVKRDDESLFFDGPMPSANSFAETVGQNATEDYFVPLNTGSMSFEMDTQMDRAMIDLTQDSPQQRPKDIAQPIRPKSRTRRPTLEDVADSPQTIRPQASPEPLPSVMAQPVSRSNSSTRSPIVEAVPDILVIEPQDSPEPQSRIIAQPVSRSKSLIRRPTEEDVPDSPPLAPHWHLPLPNTDHPRVSFAPSASVRPYRVSDIGFDTEPSPPWKRNESVPSYSHKRAHPKYLGNQTSDNKRNHGGYQTRIPYTDPMPRIIDIIREITEVVVQKTADRFDKVSKNLRAGQRSILLETALELDAMLAESIQHHNNFVGLESEYAAHHRKIIDRLEDTSKIEQELLGLLAGTIHEHNRNSLSRKFSHSLFCSPLPPVVSNPKLLL